MVGTFARLDVEEYPGFPGFPATNEPAVIVPSFATGKIFSHYKFADEFPNPGTWDDIINVHSSADGSSLGFAFLRDICAISANSLLCSPAFVLGTDGYLYAITTTGADVGGFWWNAAMKLSKIDQATLTEVDTLVPYAVANNYNTSDTDAFRLVAFELNGTNYLAIFLVNNNPNNVEIINVDTMTSVTTNDYSTVTYNIWPVVGEQPSGTSQALYFLRNETSGTADPAIIKLTFTEPATIALVTVDTYTSADFDAGWPVTQGQAGQLMYDTSDASLIFWVGKLAPAALQGTEPSYLVKVNKSTGAIVWKTGLPNTPAQLTFASCISNLSEGTLVWVPSNQNFQVGYTFPWSNPANEAAYLTFDLSDGTYDVAFSPYFDDCYFVTPLTSNAEQIASFWDSDERKLIFYVIYQGNYDYYSTSPVWDGGWAMFSLDEQPAPPPSVTGGKYKGPFPSAMFMPPLGRWEQYAVIVHLDGAEVRPSKAFPKLKYAKAYVETVLEEGITFRNEFYPPSDILHIWLADEDGNMNQVHP